jgi:hypothetical protein
MKTLKQELQIFKLQRNGSQTANYRKSHRRDKQGHHKDEGDE